MGCSRQAGREAWLQAVTLEKVARAAERLSGGTAFVSHRAVTAPEWGEAARGMVEEEGSAASGWSFLLHGTYLHQTGGEEGRAESWLGEWTTD